MKRALFVSVVLLIPIILIVVLLAIQYGQPQAWQVELDKYKVYKAASISSSLTTKRIDRATRPWHFSGVMSEAAFGENPYFGTDYGYDGQRNENGSKPIPFPPEAVWCALLVAEPQPFETGGREPGYIVVFIAEHHDLYNAALVVHESANDHISLPESLSLVGCKTVLEEIQFSQASWWT